MFSGTAKKYKAEWVLQNSWVAFETGKDQPYIIYNATPLLTCSAYLFQYTTGNNKQMTILYHALSSIPTLLPEIIDKIKADQVLLKDVSLMVFSSDESSHTRAIELATIERNIIFQENQFPEENCTVKNKGYNDYYADTRGNHGSPIPSKIILSELAKGYSEEKQILPNISDNSETTSHEKNPSTKITAKK